MSDPSPREVRRLQVMDRVDQIMLSATDIEGMLVALLDDLLTTLDCDRAWLLFPCDPNAPSWCVPMERTVPEWPGAAALNVDVPMTPDASELFEAVLKKPRPVPYDTAAGRQVPEVARSLFNVRSMMILAIHPRVGKPWLLGLHHCSEAHVYDEDAQNLFASVGRRLGDSLGSMLVLGNLQRSEASLARAQRIAHVGDWRLDFELDRLELSAEAARIYGWGAHAKVVTIAEYMDIVHPDDRQRVDHVLRKPCARGVFTEVTHQLLLSDGKVSHVQLRFETLRPVEATSLNRVGTVQDITAFRRQQDERDRLICDLERQNAELDSFVYTVSHQLRTPLVTITGFLEAIEDGITRGDPATAREDLVRVESAAHHMGSMLDELLELVRIGRAATHVADVPVAGVVDSALALVSARLEGIAVNVDVGDHALWGDRSRLIDVMQNLLENAAKFMGDQPEPTISVSAQATAGGVQIQVTDNGVGIEAAYHERVFELFARLDAKTPGTGVGLAIVKRVVEHHGGRVAVRSAGLGQGATFKFWLPSGG